MSLLPAAQRAGSLVKAHALLDALTADQFEQILEDYMLGASWEKIATMFGVSAFSLRSWVEERPEVKRAFEATRPFRAEHLANETLTIADETYDAEDVPAAALKVKARHWLAEHLDPQRFGRQVKTGVSIGELHLHALKEVNEKETKARIALMDAQREPLPTEIVGEDEDTDSEDVTAVEGSDLL